MLASAMEPATAIDSQAVPADGRPSAPPAAPAGLTEAEAARRLAAGGPRRRPATSRSYTSIVRANVLTVFNLILVAFGVVTLVFGDWRDALFLGILVANTAIGISQEVRAKRTLDRLALLVAPEALVVRDGGERRLPVEDVVEGDLVRLQAGDQVVADGRVVAAETLRLDESVLTGESRPGARVAPAGGAAPAETRRPAGPVRTGESGRAAGGGGEDVGWGRSRWRVRARSRSRRLGSAATPSSCSARRARSAIRARRSSR